MKHVVADESGVGEEGIPFLVVLGLLEAILEGDGDDFVISGEKIFIMHGDVATLFLVFGKVSEEGVRDKISAWLVEDTSYNFV